MPSAMMQMLMAAAPSAGNWILVGTGTVAMVSASGPSSASVAPPAGTSLNDVMLLFTAVNASQTVATPSGWTAVGTSPNGLDVFRKVAGASEGSVSVSASVTGIQGVIVTLRGIDTTTPVNVTAQATATSTFATFPAVTTTVPNCPVLLAVCTAGSLGAYTPGSAANLTSYSELVDSQNDYTPASTSDTSLAVYMGTMATAGSTGTPAAGGPAGGSWGSMTVALQPA